MAYKVGDLVIIRWPTRLDPTNTYKARLLAEVPETRYFNRNGEYTVGRGWSARVIAPGQDMDQWLVGHVDEMALMPAP